MAPVFGLPIAVLVGFLAVPPSAVQAIERAWLLGDPGYLTSLAPADVSLLVSLPEPIGFSDQMTGEQTLVFLKRVFSACRTFEFFPEGTVFAAGGRPGGIVTASWSFRRAADDVPQRFRMYFALVPVEPRAAPRGGLAHPARLAWRIAEIRAEKL